MRYSPVLCKYWCFIIAYALACSVRDQCWPHSDRWLCGCGSRAVKPHWAIMLMWSALKVALGTLAVQRAWEEVTPDIFLFKMLGYLLWNCIFCLTLISALEKLSADLCLCALYCLHAMCCFILWRSLLSTCLCLAISATSLMRTIIQNCTLCCFYHLVISVPKMTFL